MGLKSSLKQTEVKYSNEELLMGYKGLRSFGDKYIVLDNGKEYYFLLPNEIVNQIDNKRFQKRIQKLRGGIK